MNSALVNNIEQYQSDVLWRYSHIFDRFAAVLSWIRCSLHAAFFYFCVAGMDLVGRQETVCRVRVLGVVIGQPFAGASDAFKMRSDSGPQKRLRSAVVADKCSPVRAVNGGAILGDGSAGVVWSRAS